MSKAHTYGSTAATEGRVLRDVARIQGIIRRIETDPDMECEWRVLLSIPGTCCEQGAYATLDWTIGAVAVCAKGNNNDNG
jgi:hypothetical protein